MTKSFRGGNPEVSFKPRALSSDPYPKASGADWLGAYYLAYVERDVREILSIGNLETFQKFIRLCAGRAGQILNLSALASDTGISHTTARRWLSALQAGFIVYFLRSHHLNFSKRLIKAPKLYFFDTGLLCYLLGIRKPEDIEIHPLRGAIFENFIFSELFKAFAHLGEEPPLYFWRDRTGHEIDFVLDLGTQIIPVEAKAGETVSRDQFKDLFYYLRLKDNPARRGVLVYAGEKGYLREDILVRPWFACS